MATVPPSAVKQGPDSKQVLEKKPVVSDDGLEHTNPYSENFLEKEPVDSDDGLEHTNPYSENFLEKEPVVSDNEPTNPFSEYFLEKEPVVSDDEPKPTNFKQVLDKATESEAFVLSNPYANDLLDMVADGLELYPTARHLVHVIEYLETMFGTTPPSPSPSPSPSACTEEDIQTLKTTMVDAIDAAVQKLNTDLDMFDRSTVSSQDLEDLVMQFHLGFNTSSTVSLGNDSIGNAFNVLGQAAYKLKHVPEADW